MEPTDMFYGDGDSSVKHPSARTAAGRTVEPFTNRR